jgi:hypothetical protein
VNDTDLDEILVDTLQRHAATALPLPGDPAARVDRRAAHRRHRYIAAIATPTAAAAAVAAVVLLGPAHPDAGVPVSPAIPTTTSPSGSAGRPSVDRPVPAAALAQLQAAVHQLTEPMPGRSAALRARLTHYQVDSWRSADDFTLLVVLDLHFPSQAAGAWNQGANARFVHFSRGSRSQSYRLEWATGP